METRDKREDDSKAPNQPAITSRTEPNSDTMLRLGKIAAILGAITAVVVAGKGLLASVKDLTTELTSTIKAQRIAEERRQLRSFGTYADLVRQHRQIAPRTVKYMRDLEEAGGYCDANAVRAKALVEKYKNGAALYFSEEYKDYREIHEFYEDLGLQVRKGAADMGLVFELVTFPTDFVKKTQCLGMAISENWFGVGQRIAGFSENTESLMKEYAQRRRANALALGRAFKEPPDCDCTALGLVTRAKAQ